MNLGAMFYVNKGLRPIYYMNGPVSNANTFIYYNNNDYILTIKSPKYEENRIISAYSKNDEMTKRYKYFLYEEVI